MSGLPTIDYDVDAKPPTRSSIPWGGTSFGSSKRSGDNDDEGETPPRKAVKLIKDGRSSDSDVGEADHDDDRYFDESQE